MFAWLCPDCSTNCQCFPHSVWGRKWLYFSYHLLSCASILLFPNFISFSYECRYAMFPIVRGESKSIYNQRLVFGFVSMANLCLRLLMLELQPLRLSMHEATRNECAMWTFQTVFPSFLIFLPFSSLSNVLWVIVVESNKSALGVKLNRERQLWTVELCWPILISILEPDRDC